MTDAEAVWLFLAAMAAGAVNSVAGGGTLLTFPAALAAGLPPIVANATNAVALVPGSIAAAWTYRHRLAGLKTFTAILFVPAVLGALAGAALLRVTPQRVFDHLVPWLVLGATLILLSQGALTRRRPPSGPAPVPSRRGTVATLVVLELLVGVYGGYFGAGMGILMLAFLGSVPAPEPGTRLDLHQMNAVKNVLGTGINAAAAVDFVIHGLIQWDAAAVLAAGAILGGIVGSRLAHRTHPDRVRRFVVGIGFAATAILAWQRYR